MVEWLKEVYSLSETLMNIIESEPEGWNAVIQVLDIIKAGLYSNNGEVSVWACKLLAKMADKKSFFTDDKKNYETANSPQDFLFF